MPAEVVTEAEQGPRRARYVVPRGLPRRGEIIAACVVLVVLAHVLFAQLTIILAVVFYLITKLTRWRLSWLTVPVVAAVAWTAAVGPRAAAAGFADGPAQVARYLGASGQQVRHLLHFTAAFAGMDRWLPRQLPLAIITGAAEAALASWLSWLHTDEWNTPPARPGLIVLARRAVTVRAIRAGAVVTRDGGCLGVEAGSGTRVALAWSEAAGGISVCGSAEQDVLTTSFQLVHAAVRRRKPVLALDLTSDPDLPARLAAVCTEAGAPLQVFGPDGGACYEPFRYGNPAWRASLITAMLSWEGPGRQYRRSCVAYLEDVFELLDAAPGDPRVPVLDEVIHLLNPTAMRARMEYVPAAYPRRAALAERTRVSMSLIHAEPATTAQLNRQLRELRTSDFGRWLRPSGRGPSGQGSSGQGSSGPAAEIDLGRAVTERAVVLFRLGGTPLPSTAMLTRLVCEDLLAAGAALSGIGVDGDGLVWLPECGSLPRRAVTDMIARGPGTGLPVLAVTTFPQVATELAELTNVLVVHRMTDADAAGQLATAAGATTGPPLGDGEFLLAVKDPPRLVPRAQPVRARIPSPRSAATPRHRALDASQHWEGA
jgi:hypothetical protein